MSVFRSATAALRRTEFAQRLKATADAHWRRAAISTSPYFDAEWYLAHNDDVRRAGVDALEHFLDHGEREGRPPGPAFDVDAYVIMNPVAVGQALTHYHRTIEAASLRPGDLRPSEIFDVNRHPSAPNWFDERWYRRAHAAVIGDDLATVHPWVHYRRTGLDPSPVFDNAEYGSQLSEADRRRHPTSLDHWFEQCAATSDDRPIRPRVVSRAPALRLPYQPLIQHRVRHRSELAGLDVAVMVHAYYLDLLPSLLEAVRMLPAPPSLLVSVVHGSDAELAHRMIDDVLGAEHARIVKIAPNRGRNFAPLLCSFADEVAGHDYLLHLHTKKSLASGGEQAHWRNHLVTSLAPTPAAVDAVLSLFADDPTVGVVQAPPWEHFPHWGNHWLGNRSKGAELYDRLGVTDRVARGYLMYPVGGMFWARVDALRPLLDLGLTVGDFDREHGQTDRTLAHAIERTIPAAAAVAGFDTVEFDYAAAQWRRNWSPTTSSDFGRADASALATALESADLVSVDLFDTLLLRPTLEPDVLFDVLAWQLDAAGPPSTDPASTDPASTDPASTETTSTDPTGSELVRLRRDIEHGLRVDGSIPGDVTLDEIYAAAGERRPGHAGRLARLRRLELDLERRVAIGRTWLIEALLTDRQLAAADGRAPRRYVLMTDTTQPVAAIEALLARIGAAGLFDDLYVSNACRARKDTGTMWDLVRTVEAPETGRWLHIGDNEFSDIQQASDRGLSTFHVPAPAAIAQSRGVDSATLPDVTRAGTQLVAGHALACLSSFQHVESASPQESAIEEFGYGVLGPLTLTFANWVVQRSRERGIDRLLFTARDGHLAHELLRRIAVWLPAPIPRLDYFYMSRRVALGMLQHDGEHLADLCAAGDFAGRVADLLDARLGTALPGAAGAHLGAQHVVLPDDADWLVDQLQPFVPAIAAHGARELAAFRRYLDHLDIAPDEHLGLVDLGYSGTTQKALHSLIDQPLTGLYCVTTAAADVLGDAASSCFGRDVTVGGFNLIYDNALTYELLCSAEHPQVQSFQADAAGLRVVFDPRTAAPPELRWRVDVAQDAAIRFARDHIERFGPEALDAPVDPAVLLETFQRCVGTLIPEVDTTFDGFVIDDRFCGRGEQRVNARAERPTGPGQSSRPV